MGKGITGEIIRRHADGMREGGFVRVWVDFVLLPDPTLALLLQQLRELGGRIWDRERVLVTVDHFSPPSTIERAAIVQEVLEFAQGEGICNLQVHQGVCHQLLVEGPWVQPGMLVLGADSHTTTAGALGCLATGMGSTDILYTLITGRTWLSPPDAVHVDLWGSLPPYLMGKDVILDLLGRFGEAGFLYQALEFWDRNGGVPMADRFAICNMAVEGGAKNSLFIPDEVTWGYLQERNGGGGDTVPSYGDIDYAKNIEVDLSALTPKVALPHSPARVCEVAEVVGERVDQVFIGSCTGGRLQDLAAVASLLKGKKVAKGVRCLISPASQEIYLEGIRQGYIQAIAEAGGVILNPSCGPCGGIDKGILGKGERCLSTANRNFQGRMGDPTALVYLASPLTAAATALRGVITDPREVLG